MMLLQADVITVGRDILNVATFGLVLRVSFLAGKWAEKTDSNERRIDHLEKVACPHQECPFKVHLGLHSQIELEHEG